MFPAVSTDIRKSFFSERHLLRPLGIIKRVNSLSILFLFTLMVWLRLLPFSSTLSLFRINAEVLGVRYSHRKRLGCVHHILPFEVIALLSIFIFFIWVKSACIVLMLSDALHISSMAFCVLLCAQANAAHILNNIDSITTFIFFTLHLIADFQLSIILILDSTPLKSLAHLSI